LSQNNHDKKKGAMQKRLGKTSATPHRACRSPDAVEKSELKVMIEIRPQENG
jgi:hypothetical protein